MGKTAAERKRDQRAGIETAVAELDNDEWTETVCLYVLTAPRWRDREIGRAAWHRLGELRAYIRDGHG